MLLFHEGRLSLNLAFGLKKLGSWICYLSININTKRINLFLCSCVPVAQWLEHCVSSAKVVGSIPREHTYGQKNVIALDKSVC